MTKHPGIGLTRAQRAAFERIAVNEPPACNNHTLSVLIKRGLVVQEWEEKRDVMGTYPVPTYYVPTAIHMQWCQWCSENRGEGDIE